MKKIFFLILICYGSVSANYNLFEQSNIQQQPNLPLSSETENFKLYCMPEEKLDCQKVLAVAEKNFKQCSIDFNHKYSAKINLYVFSSLKEMHKTVGLPEAPDRVANIYKAETHSFFTVNPEHHGSYHSTENILNLNMHGIASLFIQDKYANKIPYWFTHGIGLWKSNYIDKKIVNQITQDHQLIPSLEQLENFDSSSDAYRACSYLIIEYINQQWGWGTILDILANYDSFEKILGVSKEKFKDQFIGYLETNNKSKDILVSQNPWFIIDSKLMNQIKEYDDSVVAFLVWLVTAGSVICASEYIVLKYTNLKSLDQNPILGTIDLILAIYIALLPTKILVRKLNEKSEINALKNFLDNYSEETSQSLSPELKEIFDSLHEQYKTEGVDFIKKIAHTSISYLKTMPRINSTITISIKGE